MNLKSFHLVFITCAILLAFLVGWWVLSGDALTGLTRRLTAFGAFGVGIALIAYEAWFLRYSKGS